MVSSCDSTATRPLRPRSIICGAAGAGMSGAFGGWMARKEGRGGGVSEGRSEGTLEPSTCSAPWIIGELR